MQNAPWRVFKLLKISPPGSGQVNPEGFPLGAGALAVPQEKGGSLGSELDSFAAWPPAHGGPLCAHSCPSCTSPSQRGSLGRGERRVNDGCPQG